MYSGSICAKKEFVSLIVYEGIQGDLKCET